MRSAWGSITRVSKNRYRLRYWADLHDGRGRTRHSETVRGSRKDARHRLSELEASHGTDSPTMTLGECATRFWVPECEDRMAKGKMAKSTWASYENVYRVHVEPRWGSVAVSGITPLDYQNWFLTMTDNNARLSGVAMRQILRLAVLYGLCERNVAEGTYRTGGRAKAQSRVVWSLNECAEMCRRLRGTDLEVPAVLCAFASCRVGEACGMRSEDCKVVEANGMRVLCCHVTGQLAQGGYERHLKNPQSVRWVVVPEPWSLRLESLVSDGREWLNDDGTGEPATRQRVKTHWNAAFGEGGPLSGMEFAPMRNLRASWRTFMRNDLHVERDVLEKMMGHAGRGVGERHYYRPDEEAFADVVSRAYQAREGAS